MAQKREVSSNSSEEFISLQDVLYSFNNSISEEQAWAVCYQCAQYFEQNTSQDSYRDLYYYGITAIRLSKEGDVKIDVNFNQGTGKGPPKKRSSFSLSREFKTVITPIDVRQALGTAIYKALDYGLSESEEPHLSSDLEALIEALTEDHPTDDDEGIDIERDSDQDIDDSQGHQQSEFSGIINSCTRRLSNQQNAQLHYKAVCRALATEATELVTFLDNISKGQEKLASTSDDRQPSVDDLERSDWARLWVQIMRELRHGVRLKKVEQVHLPPVEFELTPFEILLEDIRLGRYKLNRIMVNGDIPRKVKDDAHAVILDFIRSRPPLKPVNRRQLKDLPQRKMDPRELLLQDICKPHKLKPVKHGKVVVRKPTLDCDTNYSSDEESPKPVRKVIKPVAAFQVSTDDSDSYFSDPEDDYRNHINAPVMSPLDPVYPDADDISWKRAAARDLVSHPSSTCRSVSRRHTISACDIKSGTKVSQPSKHAPLPEDEEDSVMQYEQFNRGHVARKPTKIISYRKKHQDVKHANCDSTQTVSAQNYVNIRPKSPQKHVSQCLLSKSHGNLVDDVFSVSNNLHDMSSGEISHLSRSASVACISGPRRCKSPSSHIGRSHSPKMHVGRAESPVRHLSRSETFTCSVPRKSRINNHSETHIATRCDSPQTRAMRHSDSFPSQRSESPIHSHRTESPRTHSVNILCNSNDNACDIQTSSDKVRRHSVQHAHGFVSRSSHNLQNSHSLQRHASISGSCLSRTKQDSPSQRQARKEKKLHGNGSSSQSPTRERLQGDSVNDNVKPISNSFSKSENYDSSKSKTSYPQEKMASSDSAEAKSDNVTLRRSRTAIVRARSRPDIRSKDLKEAEEKHFEFIERAGFFAKTVARGDNERVRPASDLDFVQKTRSQVSRARNSAERSIVSRSFDSRIQMKSEKNDTDLAETKLDETDPKPKRAVRLSRQSAIRTEGSEIRSKLQSKPKEVSSKETNVLETDAQCGLDKAENNMKESRVRRVGVFASEKIVNNTDDSINSASDKVDNVAKRDEAKHEVASDREKLSRRNQFKQVRPILRSRSEVRPEMKPVKGSHNLPVDFEHNNLDHFDDKHLIIPPPEFRDPDDTTPTNDSSTLHGDLENDSSDIPDVIKTSRAEFKVVDLLHVSWKTECPRQDPTNQSNPCSDCRPLPSHKWQNPIECLSLTLEEVTHIRSVLTKAELEGLITNPELHSQVSKGKICFTCKKTKFSLFGQWGTKCKFCLRTVCNYCLRKMSVPTEHFEKIPVYTLSPVPLSPEVLEALKVYESTGSVPHSPISNRKFLDSDSNNKTAEEPATPVADENKTASRRKSLQRSHTIGVGVGSRPPPNKALLKGPQMSICCDCKSMIMEIIKASRSSVSLITGKPEAQDGNKDKDSLTPRGQVSARSSVVMRPRHLDLEDRPRPRSMLDNFSFKSFNFSKTSTDA